MKITRRAVLGALAAPPLPAGPAIRYGCQTRVYGVPIKDRSRLLEILSELRAAGYEGFETNFASVEAAFGDPASLRREFEARLPLIGLHLGAKLFDPKTAGKEHANIERVARAVKDFGGTHLMLSGTAVPHDDAGRLDAEALARKCEGLTRAARVCRDLGVRLCSHNHIHEAEREGEEMAAVLERTEIALIVDAGAAHLARMNTAAFLRRHGSRIAAFHLRDYRGEQEVEMGTGEADLKGLARAVRDTKWQGWMIFEMNKRPDISSRDLAVHARAWMGEAFGS